MGVQVASYNRLEHLERLRARHAKERKERPKDGKKRKVGGKVKSEENFAEKNFDDGGEDARPRLSYGRVCGAGPGSAYGRASGTLKYFCMCTYIVHPACTLDLRVIR